MKGKEKIKNAAKYVCWVILGAILGMVVMAATYPGFFPETYKEPILGGKLNESDFKGGFQVYVERKIMDGERIERTEFWRVLDRQLAGDIYAYLSERVMWRQYNTRRDTMGQPTGDWVDETIIFDCEDVGYKVNIVDYSRYDYEKKETLPAFWPEYWSFNIALLWRVNTHDVNGNRWEHTAGYIGPDTENWDFCSGWIFWLGDEEVTRSLLDRAYTGGGELISET